MLVVLGRSRYVKRMFSGNFGDARWMSGRKLAGAKRHQVGCLKRSADTPSPLRILNFPVMLCQRSSQTDLLAE